MDQICFAKTTKEIEKVQIFFYSFKMDVSKIEKLGEDILKKHQKKLNFNCPNDSLCNMWMSNLDQENQLIFKENDEDGVDQNKLQIIDALAQIEERKEEQLTIAIDEEVQTSDLTREKPIEIFDLAVQSNDLEGECWHK